jgi:hypothetical protein
MSRSFLNSGTLIVILELGGMSQPVKQVIWFGKIFLTYLPGRGESTCAFL